MSSESIVALQGHQTKDANHASDLQNEAGFCGLQGMQICCCWGTTVQLSFGDVANILTPELLNVPFL